MKDFSKPTSFSSDPPLSTRTLPGTLLLTPLRLLLPRSRHLRGTTTKQMKGHAIFYLTTFSFLEIRGFLLPQNRLIITRNAYSTCTTVAATAATCPSSPSNSFIGSTLTDMQLAFEAVGKFFDRIEGVQFEQTSGGVNNVRSSGSTRVTTHSVDIQAYAQKTQNYRSGCTSAS